MPVVDSFYAASSPANLTPPPPPSNEILPNAASPPPPPPININPVIIGPPPPAATPPPPEDEGVITTTISPPPPPPLPPDPKLSSPSPPPLPIPINYAATPPPPPPPLQPKQPLPVPPLPSPPISLSPPPPPLSTSADPPPLPTSPPPISLVPPATPTIFLPPSSIQSPPPPLPIQPLPSPAASSPPPNVPLPTLSQQTILSPPPPPPLPPPPPPPIRVTPPSSSFRLSPPLHYTPPPPHSPSTLIAPPRKPPPPSPPFQHTTPQPNDSSTHRSSSSNNNFVTGAIAAGSVAVFVVAIIAVVFYILRKRRKSVGPLPAKSDVYHAFKPSTTSPLGNMYSSFRAHGYHPALPESGVAKLWFTYEELKDVTNGFSRENLLGEGGFGCVYKGCLPDGKTVAVKQLKVGSGQGEREFRAEVEIISRVHHRHLVSLVGYCIDEHHRLLVYDYLPNKTLEYHLHGKDLPVLEWSKRMKIAIGSARGLAYLHEDCHPRIIHRDIKSANILLDSFFEAQVADFGLAKLTNDTFSHVSTRVMGTFGYMAPEYASSGKLTDRSDVFSFGVVLLELITGRKPVDPSQPLGDESLVEWVRPLLVRALETGDCEEFVDPRLEKNFAKSEMLLMIEAAAACVRHAASRRPRMVQVVRALDNEGDLSDLSNGMKFGQSTIYNSAQYSAEIQLFNRSGRPGSDEFSSSNYDTSCEHERRNSTFSSDVTP